MIATGRSIDGKMDWSSVSISELGRVTLGAQSALRSTNWWITMRGDLHSEPQQQSSPWGRLQSLSPGGPLVPTWGNGCQISVSPIKFEGLDAVGCAIGNSQACIPRLDRLLIRATETMQSGAYLHHYVNKGVSVDEIREALVQVEQVVQCYRDI